MADALIDLFNDLTANIAGCSFSDQETEAKLE